MSKRTKPTIAKNDPVFKKEDGWYFTSPGFGDQAFGPHKDRATARAARAQGIAGGAGRKSKSASPRAQEVEKPLDPAPTPVVVSETSAVNPVSQEIPMAVLKLVRTNKIGVSLYAPEGGKVCASFPKSLFAGDPPAEISVQDGILQAVKVGGGGAKASEETKAKAAANAEKAVARAKAAQERAAKAMARAQKLGAVPAEPTATDAPGQ